MYECCARTLTERVVRAVRTFIDGQFSIQLELVNQSWQQMTSLTNLLREGLGRS